MATLLLSVMGAFVEKELVKLPGGWYVQVCLRPGVTLSAKKVAMIQAAILEKDWKRNNIGYKVLDE